jgi:hypothetical protein
MGRAAGWLAGAACLAAALALALAVACIPDLPAQSGLDAGDDAATAVTGCGDGLTDLDAEQCDPGVPLAPGASFAGCTSDCKMDCDGGFVWASNNHCYTRAGRAATEYQASYQCTQVGTHVVTFASEREFEAVAGNIDAGPFWVGLVADPTQPTQYNAQQIYEPGWSATCSGCFAHTNEAGVLTPGIGGCVEAYSDLDASWRQYQCNNNAPDAGKLVVVCEREPRSTTARRCDAGVCFEIPATHGAKRYVYGPLAAPADVAAQHCASQGGSLVILQSSEEREQIWYALSRLPNLLPTADSTQIWIGLSLVDAGWVWDDGNGPDAYPSPWGNNEPDDAGAGTRAYLVETPAAPTPFDTTLASNDADASVPFPYLCQIPGGAVDAGDAGEAGNPDASDAGSPD